MSHFHLDSPQTYLGQASAEEIITWSLNTFLHGLVMTSSFGIHSAGFLHLIAQHIPEIPIIFIHHPYLPQDTNTFVKELKRSLGLNIKIYAPEKRHSLEEVQELFLSKERSKEIDQRRKHLREQYKEYPLRHVLGNLQARAWISGVMAHETPERQQLSPIFYDTSYNLTKIHPILRWSQEKLQEYIAQHNLPLNQSYFDIFKGPDQKMECGIHRI